MTLQNLKLYVELDVDDSFDTEDITRWFNKGIAQYNLIPPVTEYPFVQIDGLSTDGGAIAANIYVDEEYPLDDTFMVAIMLPYINSSVRSQDSSLAEKQLFLQEFLQAARTFKSQGNVPLTYLKDKKNTDLEIYQLGDNVYVSDMTRSPFTNNWSASSLYAEVAQAVDVIFYDANGENRKTSRQAMGTKLSVFAADAGVTTTIYSDNTLSVEVPGETIITANTLLYYGS